MTDQKPVLLLPGPDSAAAAPHYFGNAYDYVSYLTENYSVDTSAYITNGKLKPLAGREVLLWQPPSRGRSETLKAGPESILRQLLKLECKVHVIAFGESDEQYEPHVCHRAEIPKDQVLTWARAHKRAVEAPPVESVPRETTPAKRGRPRSTPEGGAPAGATIDGNTGSVFVSWQQLGLECNSNGMPHPHLANAFKILCNHPELVGRIWFDEFHGKTFQTLFQPEPVEWHDTHDTRLTVWIQTHLRLAKMGHQVVQRAVDDFARQHVRNEVREWMDGLQWDHHERLPNLIADAFGAAQNDYTAAVGRCWLVSMAARTYEPGCKVDTMPVFEGPQGLMKSTALKIIGGKWFAEMHEDITTKDFLQNLPGNLLIEVSELHAFRRAEINKIKGIISCASDRYRASYGRRAESHPRRGVWAGTTNRDDWVEDETGARRFWPVGCTEIDIDYLRHNREQLFAEAVYRFKAGEPWWNIDPELARIEQDQRRSEDPWTESVLLYAETFGEVRVPDVMKNALMLPPHQQDKGSQMRVAAVLKHSGYIKKDVRKNGRIVKFWVKQ
jgi:predicted P-loop ATPase